MTDRHAALAKLREPFPPEAISKLPKGKEDKSKRRHCNICKGYHDPSMFHLDYVGHAALTDRLLSVDPEWNWEPFAKDERGLPAMDGPPGSPTGMWIRLTVCGMTRPGYGSCEPGKSDAVKELIGDALRNAGMRFGCALELWHKGDLPAEGEAPEPPKPAERNARQDAVKTALDGLDEAQKTTLKGLWTDEGLPLDLAALSDEQCDRAMQLVEKVAEVPF